MSSEVFWGLTEVFLCPLRSSEVTWGLLRSYWGLLTLCEVLLMSLDILLRSPYVFWGLLRSYWSHLRSYWDLLMSFEVLLRSPKVLGLLTSYRDLLYYMSSEVTWGLTEVSWRLTEVSLCLLKSYWGHLGSPEVLLKSFEVLLRFYWGILGLTEVSWGHAYIF